jgi:hypothetical protein
MQFDLNDTVNRPTTEIRIECMQAKKPFYTKHTMTAKLRREIIKDFGDSACLLYEYYLRMATIGGVELTDQHAADYFGWSIHKTRRNRGLLTHGGHYLSQKYSYNNGRKGISYYIGTEMVRNARPG